MTRKQAIACIKAAGAQNDRQSFTRLYVENRISFAVAREAFEAGRKFATFVVARDSGVDNPQGKE